MKGEKLLEQVFSLLKKDEAIRKVEEMMQDERNQDFPQLMEWAKNKLQELKSEEQKS